MASDKKKHSPRRSVWNYIALVVRVFNLFRHLLHKVKAETYFVITHVVFLLMLALMLACLLTATWVSVL